MNTLTFSVRQLRTFSNHTIMKKRKVIVLAILSVFFFLSGILLSLCFGSRFVSFSAVANALLGKETASLEAKVVLARVPRTIFGILAGGALGISGTLMQSVTRNPVADPSILGINTGASLFVVVGIAYLHISSANQYIWLAILGALLTTLLVYGIASLGKEGATPLKLALSGSAVAITLGSFVSTIMLPNDTVMQNFRFWTVGSIGRATTESIRLIFPFIAVGFLLSVCLAPSLNALALGDEAASALGVNVKFVRSAATAASALLCGATTALAGPIGFVGLMVPHLIRLFLGSEMRLMMPFSFLGSSTLLLISDIIGRIIGSPGETEVGIVTAVLGAPLFIYIIRKGTVSSL